MPLSLSRMGNSLTTLWAGVEKDIEQVRSAFTKLDCILGSTVEVRRVTVCVRTALRSRLAVRCWAKEGFFASRYSG